MKNLITTTTEHNNTTNVIKINNSTEFKDFDITCTKYTTKKDSVTTSIHIQLNNENPTSLQIGNIVLYGREIELFKEFINQDNKISI